jgi:formylglycine-generating enzyme required for sulfatase activity
MVAELYSHLAAQFKRLKENNDPSHKHAIEELLDPKSYVLLCTPNSKLPKDEASFEMGPDQSDGDRTVFVTFKTPFAIACYTLTRAQMRLWDNGFEGLEDRLAATDICWYDAYYFCRYLGGETLTLKDGKAYRFTFPTEAQWEYSCRAGSTTAYCYGDDEEELTQYA